MPTAVVHKLNILFIILTLLMQNMNTILGLINYTIWQISTYFKTKY